MESLLDHRNQKPSHRIGFREWGRPRAFTFDSPKCVLLPASPAESPRGHGEVADVKQASQAMAAPSVSVAEKGIIATRSEVPSGAMFGDSPS